MKKNINLILSIVAILFLSINSCKKDKPIPLIPSITTTLTTTAISYISASSGGEVTADGGTPITSRGICWNTSVEPTILNSKTTETGGVGVFTSNLNQLAPNTLFYLRAYATNSAGTGYGNQVIFTTSKVLVPVISTSDITLVSRTTAVSGGNITNDMGGLITSRGICWSTSHNPTILNSKTIDGTGTGSYSSSIAGLVELTTYYVRAYAINSAGTSYGNELTFTTITLPTLTTKPSSLITATTVTSGVSVTRNGGSALTALGVCWSVSPNPTNINSNITYTSISTGWDFDIKITGLILNTNYFIRAFATNSAGTIYGNEVSFKTQSIVTIGDDYQGGSVGYLLQLGDIGYSATIQHGLIVAPSNQSDGITWYNGGFTTTGAIAEEIGTGNANTNTIVNSQGPGNYAAKLCYDLVLNGYNDWYLPSIEELGNLKFDCNISGVISPVYWSSTEIGQYDARIRLCNPQYFSVWETLKYETYAVRAVRAF